MKLRDAESWLPNHLDRVDRLGKSLGPTLVQLPPRWRRNVARLDEWRAEGTEIYAYFNNDIGAMAPIDAQWLRARLDESRAHPIPWRQLAAAAAQGGLAAISAENVTGAGPG